MPTHNPGFLTQCSYPGCGQTRRLNKPAKWTCTKHQDMTPPMGTPNPFYFPPILPLTDAEIRDWFAELDALDDLAGVSE